MKTLRCLPAIVALIASSGCTSVPGTAAQPAPDGAPNENLVGKFAAFSQSVRVELDRFLAAQRFAPFSETEAERERVRFLFFAGGWKTVETIADGTPVTKSVRLFADPVTRRMAIFVEAVDREQKRQPQLQAGLERAVGEIVARLRFQFEKDNPDFMLHESEDWAPGAAPGPAAR